MSAEDSRLAARIEELNLENSHPLRCWPFCAPLPLQSNLPWKFPVEVQSIIMVIGQQRRTSPNPRNIVMQQGELGGCEKQDGHEEEPVHRLIV